MKNKGFNSRRFLLFAGVMLTLLHVGSVTAWGAKEKEKEVLQTSSRAVPPVVNKGVSSEDFELTISLDPLITKKYNVYLDKFVVWTKDTASVIEAVENRKFIKNISLSKGGSWRISINTGDAKAGKQLREKLRTLKEVDRLDNHLYTPNLEVAPSDELSAKLYNNSDSIEFKKYAESLGLSIERYELFSGIYWILRINPGNKRSVQTILSDLLSSGMVMKCDVLMDYMSSIQDFSYDPYIKEQWGLYNLSNLTEPRRNKYTDLDVGRAWNLSTGRDINICIIDKGFDIFNDDIKGNLKKCYDASYLGDSILANDDHGTWCATIAAGVRNNDFGISGVAPDAKLMLVRIEDSENPNDLPLKPDVQIANGISWAIYNGADIISCSLSFAYNYIIEDLISIALTEGRGGKGCIFVNSAGNNGVDSVMNFPARVSGVMAIGSVDSNIRRAWFSNYGKNLFAVAPGVNICMGETNGTIIYKNGTSFACPAVAGVAALILQVYPEATVSDVREIIQYNSFQPDDWDNDGRLPGVWSKEYGYGFVNSYYCVREAISRGKKGWSVPQPYPTPDLPDE